MREHVERLPRKGRAEKRATVRSYARLHPPNLKLRGRRRVWQSVVTKAQLWRLSVAAVRGQVGGRCDA